MKFKLRALVAGAVTAAAAGSGILAMASPAFAAGSAPPFEPDGNAAPPYGNIVFYDANGVPVQSGTNLASPFAYAVATTTGDTGATKAIVNFYNPQHGVLPANWTGTAETGTTTFSPAASLPAGTPATVSASAPANPVAATSAASVTSWLTQNTPDTTAGYANTIQVRRTDSGAGGHGNAPGTYWETDIGYNTTAAPITVDGTTVPANGWAQLFPLTSSPAPATTLATSATGGHLTAGSPITLTATTATSPAGSVVFEDNGAVISTVTVAGGTAQFVYTPANGSHSYTASFVPSIAGVESGANTSTATQVGASTSAPQAVTVSAPQVNTAATLSADNTSVNFGTTVNFTSTVSEADAPTTTGLAGTVQLFNGSSPITGASATTTAGAPTVHIPVSSLPSSTDSITAQYTPTDSGYAPSTSAPVVVTVAAPAACSLTGSSCSDTQNIQVTVNPGTITITTPYTATNPFVLPDMTLSSDGTYFQSSATFPASTLPGAQQIVVTSSLTPAYAWTLSVAATPLVNGSSGTIPASGLGLTHGTLLNATGTGAYSGSVTFTDIPALNPSPVDAPGSGPGLSGTPQTWAHSTAADGTAEMDGTLTLDASTATPSGTYTGTITFSVS